MVLTSLHHFLHKMGLSGSCSSFEIITIFQWVNETWNNIYCAVRCIRSEKTSIRIRLAILLLYTLKQAFDKLFSNIVCLIKIHLIDIDFFKIIMDSKACFKTVIGSLCMFIYRRKVSLSIGTIKKQFQINFNFTQQIRCRNFVRYKSK